MSYDRRVTNTEGEAGGNETPHRVLRVPDRMWEAFGRVCARRGTSRAARILEMIGSEIRTHGDARDLADLEAAEEELKERRSRRGIRHRRKPRQVAEQEPSGDAVGTRD